MAAADGMRRSVTLPRCLGFLAGVMEFLGYSRKGKPVTLLVYGHMTEETFAQARSAIDRTLFKLHSVGTVTELRQAR